MRIQTLLSNILSHSESQHITPFQKKIKTTYFLQYPLDFSLTTSPKFHTITFNNKLEKALIFHESQEKECLKLNQPQIERIFLNCQAKQKLSEDPKLYIRERRIGFYKPELIYPNSKKVTDTLKKEIYTCNLYRLCIFCSTLQAFYLTLTCNSISHYLQNKTFPLIAIYNLQIPHITSFFKKLYNLSDTHNTIYSLFPEPTIHTYSLFIIPSIPLSNDISLTIYLEDYLTNLTQTLKLPNPQSLPFEFLKISFDLVELSLNLFLFLYAPIDLTKPSFHDINQILLAKVIFPNNIFIH